MNEKYLQIFNEIFRGNLPGNKSHVKMLPLGRRLDPAPEPIKASKKSSVLIILYLYKHELKCILIKRPMTMKYHAGQIAFPGGIINTTDPSPLEAAIREANEEVGIKRNSFEIVGELSDLYIPVSGFIIYPFVAICRKTPVLKPNIGEVEEILHFSISEQITNEIIHFRRIETTTGFLDIPCYLCKNEIIWGATAMILSELIDLLKTSILT